MKIIDISNCSDGVIVYINNLQKYIDEKDKEIERLNNIINKAIEYLESYNTDFKNCRSGEAPISIRELGDLLDILKGSDKEWNYGLEAKTKKD